MYIIFVDAIQGDERAKGRKGEGANNVLSNWCFFTIFAA